MRNCAVSPKYKLTYIGSGKCASRSMVQFMRHACMARVNMTPHEAIRYEGFTKFCVVRCPYDRALSLYNFAAMHPSDRYQFRKHGVVDLKSMVCALKARKIRIRNYDLTHTMTEQLIPYGPYDFVLHIENLVRDLRYLWGRMGIRGVFRVPHINQSEGPKPTLSRDDIKAINEWCPEDFKNFNYEMLDPCQYQN